MRGFQSSWIRQREDGGGFHGRGGSAGGAFGCPGREIIVAGDQRKRDPHDITGLSGPLFAHNDPAGILSETI